MDYEKIEKQIKQIEKELLILLSRGELSPNINKLKNKLKELKKIKKELENNNYE